MVYPRCSYTCKVSNETRRATEIIGTHTKHDNVIIKVILLCSLCIISSINLEKINQIPQAILCLEAFIFTYLLLSECSSCNQVKTSQ